MATQHGTETGYDLEEPPAWSWEEMAHFLSSGSALNKRNLFSVYHLFYQQHMFRELRKHLEDPDCQEVSWARPYFGDELEIEWAWTVSDASTSQPVRRWINHDKPQPSLTPLKVLTAGAASLKKGETCFPLLPVGRVQEFENLDPDQKARFLKEWQEPVCYSDGPRPGVLGRKGDEIVFRARRAFTISPLVIDADQERSSYFFVAGLLWEGDSPETWTQNEQDALWQTLDRSFDVLLKHCLSVSSCPEKVTRHLLPESEGTIESFEAMTRGLEGQRSYLEEVRPKRIQETPLRFLVPHGPASDDREGPVLPITDGLGRLKPLAVSEVLARMWYPDERLRRHQWLAVCEAKALAMVSHPAPPDVAALLCDAPPWEELLELSAKSSFGGLVAGEILLFALNCADQQPDDLSVRKAIQLMRQELLFWRNPRGKRTKRGVSTIKRMWSRYKPVAHLWAAHQMWYRDYQEGSTEPPEHWAEDEGNLIQFLSLAEVLRTKAHSAYARGTERHLGPLLDPSTTWRTPPDLQLVPFSLESPPLTDWAQTQLASYSTG